MAIELNSGIIVLVSICAALGMNFYPAVATEVREDAQPDGTNFGPYMEIYPTVNLSSSQLDCNPQPADNRTPCPLYIALMMSFGIEYDSSGVIASVQYALDQINADPNLLPGYSLHYTLTDSQVHYTLWYS